MAQTHRDYHLIVVDESTLFDIDEVVAEYAFQQVTIIRVPVTPEQRAHRNPVGANMNLAMPLAQTGLVCFLCDDDYYYPNWFASASQYFEEHPDHHVGFGILNYSRDQEMSLQPATQWGRRFFNEPLTDPFCKLDHNQVVHRVFSPPYKWPEDLDKIKEPDGYYFRELAKEHVFYPIAVPAVVKREHDKALRWNVQKMEQGTLEATRE